MSMIIRPAEGSCDTLPSAIDRPPSCMVAAGQRDDVAACTMARVSSSATYAAS
jgi:hypothetical protein